MHVNFETCGHVKVRGRSPRAGMALPLRDGILLPSQQPLSNSHVLWTIVLALGLPFACRNLDHLQTALKLTHSVLNNQVNSDSEGRPCLWDVQPGPRSLPQLPCLPQQTSCPGLFRTEDKNPRVPSDYNQHVDGRRLVPGTSLPNCAGRR